MAILMFTILLEECLSLVSFPMVVVSSAAAATPSAPSRSVIVDGAGEGRIGCLDNRTVADDQELALDQRGGDSLPCAGEDPSEGGTGDPHPRGGGFLIEPFEIGEAQGLELVEADGFDLEFAGGSAHGLQTLDFGPASDLSELFGSCHLAS
jgi:hypothetical protein